MHWGLWERGGGASEEEETQTGRELTAGMTESHEEQCADPASSVPSASLASPWMYSSQLKAWLRSW